MITHDVESKLIDQCDRLIVLQPGGKMAYFGPPATGCATSAGRTGRTSSRRSPTSPSGTSPPSTGNSPEFVKYVATPISVRQQRLDAGRPEGEEAARPKQRSSFNQVFTMARRYRRVMQADRVFIATTILMPILLGALVRATPDKLRPGQRVDRRCAGPTSAPSRW